MSKRRSKRISTLGARLTSMVSVALVLVLLGLAAMIGLAGATIQDEVKRNIGFVAVMDKECTAEQLNAMKTCLLSQPAVKSFAFSSAEDILASESEYMGQDIAAIADGNPYSSEFDVKVRPAYASADSIASFAAFIADMPGVQEVNSESTVIEGIDTTVRRVTMVLSVMALVLLVVAVALIGNTVSLSVYGRRFIIHTMKLVGATPGFIRRPFVMAGLRDGFIAGLLASAVIVAFRYYAPRVDPIAHELVSWQLVAIVCAAMVLAGAIISSLTALVAANRYLRASYDEMFLK